MKPGLYYIEYIFEGQCNSEYIYVTEFGVTRLNCSPVDDNHYPESLQEYVRFYDYSTYERVL